MSAMALHMNGLRIGAVAVAVGLSLAGPQALGVASADSSDADSASTSAKSGEALGRAGQSLGGRSRAGRPTTGTIPRAGAARPEPAVDVARDSSKLHAAIVAASEPTDSTNARTPAGPASKAVRSSTSTQRVKPVLPHDDSPAQAAMPSQSAPNPAATTPVGAEEVLSPASWSRVAVNLPAKPTAASAEIASQVSAGVDDDQSRSGAGTAVATATPAFLTELNATVTRWFDATAALLGNLPTTPVSEFLQGALLLARRTLFNQLPTAHPENYLVGPFGNTVGTIDAVDPEGDALTYSLAQKPLHGTVEIDPDGTYTYTPGADFAGYDSFTVAVADRGFNLLNPFANRSTEAFVEVPHWSRGGPSANFDIYNFTGQNVLVRSVTHDPSVANPVEPRPGLIVHPGETVHLEIASALSSSLEPTRISFAVPQGPTWEVSINPDLLGTTARVSCTQGYCTYPSGAGFLTPQVLLVDAPGTIWDYSQNSIAGQQILNSLLKASESLPGTVNLSYDGATFAPKVYQPTDYVTTNQGATNDGGNETFKYGVTASVTTTKTKSSNWEVDASITPTILKVVDVAVGAKYGQAVETSEARTFQTTREFNAIPYSYNAVFAAAPQINVTGDLKATFGACTMSACTSTDPNVTFWFRDLDYTYPDPQPPADTVLFYTRTEPYQKDQTEASLNKGFQVKDARTWASDPTVPLDPTYQVGEQHQLLTKAYVGATVAQSEDFTRFATYSSSNEAVATVSASGLVTALSPGTTRITATYAWEIPGDQKGQVGAYMDVTVAASAT